MCRALAIHSIPSLDLAIHSIPSKLVYEYMHLAYTLLSIVYLASFKQACDMHAFRHDAHRDGRVDDEVIGGGSGRVVGGAAPGGDNQRTRGRTSAMHDCGYAQVLGGSHTSE